MTANSESDDFDETTTGSPGTLSPAATPTGGHIAPESFETKASAPFTSGNPRSFLSNRVGNAAVGLHGGVAAAGSQRRSNVAEPLARTAEGGEGGAQVGGHHEPPKIQGAGTTFGIDMCEFSFRVDPDSFNPDESLWDTVRPAKFGTREGLAYTINGRKHGDLAYKITVYQEPHWEAFVTMFNPSKIPLDPSIVILWSTVDLTRACAGLAASHAGLLSPQTLGNESAEEAAGYFKLQRLDVARDFYTQGAERWVTTAGGLRVPRWTTTYTHSKGAVTGTVYIGTPSNKEGFRIYVKGVQTRGAAPEGTLRVEFQFRGPHLKRAGLPDLRATTPEAVEAAFLRQWEKLGLHHPLRQGGTYQALDKLAISEMRRLALVGYQQSLYDRQPVGLNPKTNRGVLTDLRRAGLRPGDPVLATAGSVRYLDVYTGREVVLEELEPPV